MDSTKNIEKKNDECVNIKSSISAYCAGEMSAEERISFEAHVSSCESCKSDLLEYKNVIEILLANTATALEAPQTISPKKRKRLLWLMQHPFFAFCLEHHRLTSFVISITTVILVLLALLTIKVIVDLSKPVSAPVTIILEDPGESLPELDEEEPIPLE